MLEKDIPCCSFALNLCTCSSLSTLKTEVYYYTASIIDLRFHRCVSVQSLGMIEETLSSETANSVVNDAVIFVVVKLYFNSPDAQALLPSRCGR